ncbi:hypothetical protein ACJZ2D_016475 [Fusarium nematophilum]
MGIVAVAGGTGGIGRALVEAIVARGKHQVKVLGRKPNDALATELGAPIIVVDYDNVEGLTNVLQEHGFDTVVSALATLPTEGVQPEVNLVRAAEASKPTRRFVASNWGAPMASEVAKRIPQMGVKALTTTELKKTSLEYTSFYTGFLLDYYAFPTFKTYMKPLVAIVDMVHNAAAIPGSGSTPGVFVHTFDLAKYVDRALDLERWEPEYYVVGDRVTWNEFVKIAEEAKGVKFNVVHDSIEDLEKGRSTELPALTEALRTLPIPREALLASAANFGLMFERGDLNFNEDEAINRKFPDIKPLKVEEALKAVAKSG